MPTVNANHAKKFLSDALALLGEDLDLERAVEAHKALREASAALDSLITHLSDEVPW